MDFPHVLAKIVGEENSLEIVLDAPVEGRREPVERQFRGRIHFDTTLSQGGAGMFVAFDDIDAWELFLSTLASRERSAWREYARGIAIIAVSVTSAPGERRELLLPP